MASADARSTHKAPPKARAGKLTDAHLRNAKPKEKLYRIADGGGLCAEVIPTGSIYWRLRYRHAGKARMAGLGRWPEVSLKAAREASDQLRALVRSGIDPVQHQRDNRRKQAVEAANTFEVIARDWLAHNPDRLAENTLAKARSMLETYVFPSVGKRPIAEIKASELLDCLRKPERAGKLETAHRLHARASQVFRWAIATDRAETDPCRDLRGALRTRVARHHPALTNAKAIGKLLRAIDAYQGQYTTRAALKLQALLFVRPGELRMAEWTEFDLDGAEPTWTIPGTRMKGRKALASTRPPHLVPLSRQAVEILRELRHLTGRCRLAFPSVRKVTVPISINTLNAALKSMGFADTQTAHGFRAVASTLLNEKGHDPAIIEAQLSHKMTDKVAAAYNRAEYLTKRRAMMQQWADTLDSLRLADE